MYPFASNCMTLYVSCQNVYPGKCGQMNQQVHCQKGGPVDSSLEVLCSLGFKTSSVYMVCGEGSVDGTLENHLYICILDSKHLFTTFN